MLYISNVKSPAPKERGSPSPTFGTKVGLGGKAQSYSVKLKIIYSNPKFKILNPKQYQNSNVQNPKL